jgi:hypothetical protein
VNRCNTSMTAVILGTAPALPVKFLAALALCLIEQSDQVGDVLDAELPHGL